MGDCVVVICLLVFFFFKQMTEYVLRISDWSSDVCSSDLRWQLLFAGKAHPRDESGKESIRVIHQAARALGSDVPVVFLPNYDVELAKRMMAGGDVERKSVVRGKWVTVRVDLGCSRIIKIKTQQHDIQDDQRYSIQ